MGLKFGKIEKFMSYFKFAVVRHYFRQKGRNFRNFCNFALFSSKFMLVEKLNKKFDKISYAKYKLLPKISSFFSRL